MRAVVRVTWTKVYDVEIECETINKLREDVMAQVETTIERLDSAVGDRYSNPDDENMQYEVLGPLACKKCGSDLKDSRCTDETCPYSNRDQDATYTEG